MKVYLVMFNYNDAEGDYHSFVGQVYSTRELAEEFVYYNQGDCTIKEWTVSSEASTFTKYAKQAVLDGKMKIVGTAYVFGKDED